MISKEVMKNLQNCCDFSNETVLDVAASLRDSGVKIEPGLKQEIRSSGKVFADHFEVKNFDLEVKVGDELVVQSKPVVLCKDVDQFVEFVKSERKIKKSVSLKLGADGGTEKFEICLKIFLILIFVPK